MVARQAASPAVGVRRSVSGWVWWVCLLLWLGVGQAAAFELQARSDTAQLRGTVSLLPDGGGAVHSLEQVRSPAWVGRFEPAPPALRGGPAQQPHWLRVSLEQTGHRGEWVLAFPTTAITSVVFHGPFNAQGQALAPPVETGLSAPFATRPLGSERLVMRLRLAEPGSYTVYVRLVSDTSQSFALQAWELTDYLASRQDKRLFDGICYGILLALLIYNLVLAGVFRDAAFGWYVLTCGFALLTLASFNGHAAHYLVPDAPAWAVRLNVLGPALWMACSAMFARYFLDLPRHTPWLAHWLWGVVALAMASVALAGWGDVESAQRLNEVSSVAAVLLILWATLRVYRQGYAPAMWYLAGQALLFVAVLAMVLESWGLFQSPFWHANGLQVGVSAELAVFALALSRRIRLLRQAQRDLELRSQALAQVADTDPLTGLLNRAALTREAAALLARPGTHALVMVDLDRFKEVNDRFGHQGGDEVLQAVAGRLRGQLRSGDLVARIGGDEFVLLLPNQPDLVQLQLLLERLQDVIRQPIRSQHQPMYVDSSMGLSLSRQPGTTLATLMQQADEAMYRVKRSGRGSYRLADMGSASQPPAPASVPAV